MSWSAPDVQRARRGRLLLAMDAGGTSTRAVLADERGGILGAGVAGPGNPLASWAVAQGSWRSARQAAFAEAGIVPQAADIAWLGVAGAGRDSTRERLLRFFGEQRWAERIHVATDGDCVLHAAPQSPLVAIVGGTGAAAFARTADGRCWRAGGWGAQLGDEGGGRWSALLALRSILRSHESGGDPGRLGRLALEHFQITAFDEIPAAVADNGLRLAAFATRVGEAARDGDRRARWVATVAGRRLASLAGRLLRQTGIRDHHLALAGGWLLHCDVVERTLLRRHRGAQRAGEVLSLTRVDRPILGAVAAAREL